MSKYRRLKNKQHCKRAYLKQVKFNKKLIEESKRKRLEKRKLLRSKVIWSEEDELEPFNPEVENDVSITRSICNCE